MGYRLFLLICISCMATPGVAQQPAEVPSGDPVITEEAAAADTGEPESEPETREPPPEALPPPLSREERDNRLLHQQQPGATLFLDEERTQVALFIPAASANPAGTLVILHEAHAPSGLPVSLESLRRHLPASGWASLAFAIPGPAAATPPPADRPEPLPPAAGEQPAPEADAEAETTASDEPPANPEAPVTEATAHQPAGEATPDEETAGMAIEATEEEPAAENSVETLPDQEALTRQRLALVYNQVGDEAGQGVVLVMETRLAEVILPLIDREQLPLRGLVLVNNPPYRPRTHQERDSFFQEHRLPLLEIFPAPATRDITAVQQLQQAAARRQQHPAYRQLLLPMPGLQELDNQRSYWVERVRGFLTRLPGDRTTP